MISQIFQAMGFREKRPTNEVQAGAPPTLRPPKESGAPLKEVAATRETEAVANIEKRIAELKQHDGTDRSSTIKRGLYFFGIIAGIATATVATVLSTTLPPNIGPLGQFGGDMLALFSFWRFGASIYNMAFNHGRQMELKRQLDELRRGEGDGASPSPFPTMPPGDAGAAGAVKSHETAPTV